MGIILRGFFRCPCGKIHSFGGLVPTSRCACGRCLSCVTGLYGWACFLTPHHNVDKR